MLNATELRNGLGQFYGTERYHKITLTNRILATDGVAWLCENAECYWLADLIASAQLIKRIRQDGVFQSWKLKVNNRVGVVTCDDGNGNVLYIQEVPYTDFPLDEITLWVEACEDPDGNLIKILLLPSEH